MADAPPQDRRPIKLILPNQGRERLETGGGPKKLFRRVDSDYRQGLARQVVAIKEAVSPHLPRTGTAPVRARLLPEASAKSHRPENLFSKDTCPIIGAGGLGELFLKATPHGLDALIEKIKSNTSDRITKELSAVQSIEPVTPSLRRDQALAQDILRRSPKRDKRFLTRVRLFDYGGDPDQDILVEDFFRSCESVGIPIERGGYSPTSYTFRAECQSVNDVEALSGIVGVRSVREMPVIRMLRPKLLNSTPLPASLPSANEFEGEFPIVAVVDSGISSGIPALDSWVIGRQTDVPNIYSNPIHGTFVAGLICWGAQLNPHLATFLDTNPCGLFDLQVIPNTDPDFGDITFLTEEELLSSLTTALEQHANRIKVWNLSLGSDEVCALDRFSPLGQELDKLQDKFKVTFVISAGNYDSIPLLDYPRVGNQLNEGRITSPADSAVGITVGAISHIDYPTNGPRQHCPSPFSRHGAGPNYIIKPDVVQYGGTCTTDLGHASGIRSVTASGCAEDLGTSFSTPLVSRSLAQVYHSITPMPSPVLARALLTHHARDPRTGGRVPDGEEHYLGFGVPTPVPYCLECTPHTATLVFEDQLRPGFYLEWIDFPYPPSLRRSGRYFGEISMTVAFSPACNARWGIEYCETHIEANFGVYYERVNRKTGEVSEKFRGLVPPEHKSKGHLFESYQVERLRKWSPVRTYHANLNPKGERGQSWRLRLKLLTRHGIQAQETFRPHPFALIVTISDPEKKTAVYDEMAQIVRTRFQAENLTVRAAARIRARS